MENKMKKFCQLLLIITTFGLLLVIHFTSNACPQGPPDYIDQYWEGSETGSMPLSPTCTVYFHYCWRTVKDASGYVIFNDVCIWHFWLAGDCNGIDINPEHYRDIIEGCLGWLVAQTPNDWEMEIPDCSSNQSEQVWRMMGPTCLTELYPKWEWVNGKQVIVLAADICESPEHQGYCYCIYQYCWDKTNPLMPVLVPTVVECGKFTNNFSCVGWIILDDGRRLECHPTCREEK